MIKYRKPSVRYFSFFREGKEQMKKILETYYVKHMILILLIFFTVYITEILKSSTSITFDFMRSFGIDFLRYTLMGAIISLMYVPIFDKNTWTWNFKLDRMIMTIVFLFTSMTLISPIGFIVKLFLDLNIPVSIGILPFQILFGYSLMHLFIKD